MPFKAPSNFSKANLLQGYKTLNQLWNRDLLPKDLERHYFLHWFVAYQGNIIQTAEALQLAGDDIHRERGANLFNLHPRVLTMGLRMDISGKCSLILCHWRWRSSVGVRGGGR